MDTFIFQITNHRFYYDRSVVNFYTVHVRVFFDRSINKTLQKKRKENSQKPLDLKPPLVFPNRRKNIKLEIPRTKRREQAPSHEEEQLENRESVHLQN